MNASDDIERAIPVTSGVITVTPDTYARAALYRLSGRWWWVAVVPMAFFAVASLWDDAYIFAAFIWLLMLLPPALMIAYYSYLLKPEAAAMSKPHRVTIRPGGELCIDFEQPADDEDARPHEPITLPSGNLHAISEKSGHIEVCYRNSDIALLIIPFAALPAPKASHALASLYGALPTQSI